jgi:hypothetical protein
VAFALEQVRFDDTGCTTLDTAVTSQYTRKAHGRSSRLMMKQHKTHKRECGSGDPAKSVMRSYLTALYFIAQLGSETERMQKVHHLIPCRPSSSLLFPLYLPMLSQYIMLQDVAPYPHQPFLVTFLNETSSLSL